jgi:uncharacterized membrane protein YfcA
VDFPVITDPLFYALAVPAVILLGLSKSGFLAGFGSLATPLLALAVPVPQAAAIMLPLLLVMDLLGVRALWLSRDRGLIRLLVPAGLLGSLIGMLTFGMLSTKMVSGIVGGLTLMFLLQRLLFPPKADAPPPPRWVGAILGTMTGFTSFVAHAGGPPVSAYLLPQRLPPLVFAGTNATLFAIINLSKWGPYAWLGLIDWRNMATSLLLIPLAPVGVWLGVWLMKHVPTGLFYRLAYAGMGLTGVKLLWDGLK